MITLKNFRRFSHQHKLLTPVMFVAAFVTVGTILLLATHAATPLQSSVSWSATNTGGQLLNINSKLCLSTPGTAEGGNGTVMQLSTCDGGHTNKNQQWTMTWGNGTVVNTMIKNGFGQCLDDRQGGTTVGNTVQIWSCGGGGTINAQTWSTGYGDGTIRIHGLCLGVSGNLKVVNAAVVLMSCNLPPPTPSISITAPASGATVGGSSVAVSATASVPYGSVTSITLSINGATLKTCANATSCSATWNTSSVQNGSYTITVNAAATDGGGAQATRSVTVNNAAPAPPPPPSSNPTPPKSGGSGGGGSSGSSSPQPATGVSSSGSDANTDLVQSTAPSDGVQSDSADTSGNVSSSSSGNSSSNGSGSNNNNSQATATPRHKNSIGKIALLAVLLTLFTGGLIWLVIAARNRRENALPPLPVFNPNTPTYPQEDSATTAARLNWWLPEDQRQAIAHHQPVRHAPAPPEEAPVDMYEEGRKRLEEEEKRRRLER